MLESDWLTGASLELQHMVHTELLWENVCQHSGKALQSGSLSQTEPKGSPKISLMKRYKASWVQRGFTTLPIQPRMQVPCSQICDSLWFYRSPNYKESSLVGAWIASHSSKNITENQMVPTGLSIEEKCAELAGGLFKESQQRGWWGLLCKGRFFFQKMKSYHSNKVQKPFRLSFCLKISLSTNLQGQTYVIVKDFEK